MAVSLYDLCTIQIRNGVENGTMPHVHRLPWKERKSILEAVIMHRTINDPNCVEILGSPEFLKDFTSLNMQLGGVDDRNFLDHAAISLSTILPGGQRLGDNVSELQLNLFLDTSNHNVVNFAHIIRLIAQCPGLSSLSLNLLTVRERSNFDEKLFSSDIFGEYDGPGLLNDFQRLAPCLSILENLDELSFNSSWNFNFFKIGYPMIKFKRLTSLRAIALSSDNIAYSELLNTVRGTLTSLYLEVFMLPVDTRCVLPLSLPNLKWFTAKSTICCLEGSDLFLQNLKSCPQLEYIYLEMDERPVRGNPQMELAQIIAGNAVVEVKVNLCDDEDEIFENPSEFKFVTLMGNKVKSFRLYTKVWNQHFTAATQHLIDTCRELTCLELHTDNEGDLDEMSFQALREAKLLTTCLFADEIRASKLSELSLFGEYDERVLELIFQNCYNIVCFYISNCPQFNDQHLVEWVDRGVRLSEITIYDCEHITDDGLIPVVMSSGAKLENFDIVRCQSVSKRLWVILIEYCRYIKSVRFPDDDLKHLAVSKCFRKSAGRVMPD